MHITKILSEKLKHQFRVHVPAVELQGKFNLEMKKIGAKARIPGFRPGKAPKAILEQKYGAQAWEDAGNSALQEAFSQIYKEHKFRNAVDPVIDIISFEKEKDLEFTVAFEVFPDIGVKTFKDISLDVLKVDIADRDVEERLGKMCDEHVRYQEPEDARAAHKGDLVSVAWSGTLEDGKGIELPKTYQILLGPEKDDSPFYPIVTSLYGKAVGDHFEGEIQFSEEEKIEGLAGKKAKIKLEVTKIEEPLTFQMDDAFAKELKFETLDDLRKHVRQSLEHEGQKVAYLYMKRKLLDALDAQYDFDLPPTMVENEFKAIWNQLQRELSEARANGELSEDEEQKSEEDLKSEYEGIAKRRVRLGLLISHLGDAHKIKLNDEEIQMAVFQEVMRYPSKADEIIKYYANNKQSLQNLVAPLLEDKVVEFILGQSDVTERTIDFPTLKKMVRDVIPTPYDDEVDEAQEGETASAPERVEKRKLTVEKVEKAKTVKVKGKKA